MVYRSKFEEESLKEFAISLSKFTCYPYVAFNPLFIGNKLVLSYNLSETPMSWNVWRWCWAGEDVVNGTINMDIRDIKDTIDWSKCHFNIPCSAYEEQYCKGFNDGVDKGYELGYDNGFDNGFDEGVEATECHFERRLQEDNVRIIVG